MSDLKYSLVIEATPDPAFFCFYSPDLEGFTGGGRSVEDCLCQARLGIEEFVSFLREEGFPVPPENPSAQIQIHDQA